MKFLKKLSKFKWIIGISSIVVSIFIFLMLIMAPIAGLYEIKSFFMDKVGNEPEDISIEDIDIDAKPEDVEKIIDEMEEDIFKDSDIPITLDEMKKALKQERQTYFSGSYEYDIKEFKINETYDLESNKRIYYNKDTVREMKENQEFKEIEYPYRLPWQMIAISNLYLGKDITKVTVESLTPRYLYSYPEITSIKKLLEAIFGNNSTSDYLNNHQSEYKNEFTIPYDDKTENFVTDEDSFLDESYNRYDSINETKEITIVKHMTKDKNGWTTVSNNKYITRNITKTYPKPKIKEIESPLKIIKYEYERVQVIDQLIDYDTYTETITDDEDEITEIIYITKYKYKSSDSFDLKEEVEIDNSFKFANFLNDSGINVKNVEDFKNLLSLLPAGYYIASDIQGEQLSEYLDYGQNILGDIKGYIYIGDIKIEPSELVLPIPRFSQIDKRWSRLPYGSSTIGKAGCGPTAAAMIITGMTNEIVTPVDAVAFSVKHGYKVASGTAWGFFPAIGNQYGLSVIQFSKSNYKEVLEELRKGNPVVASMGPGHFTRGGHFIVLTGIDERGLIIVNDSYDPLGIKNRSWNFKVILNEAKGFFVFKK